MSNHRLVVALLSAAAVCCTAEPEATAPDGGVPPLDGTYAVRWACLCPADAVNPRGTSAEVTIRGGGTVVAWSDGAIDSAVNRKERCADVATDALGASYRLCLTPDGLAGELVWTPGQTWRLTGVRE